MLPIQPGLSPGLLAGVGVSLYMRFEQRFSESLLEWLETVCYIFRQTLAKLRLSYKPVLRTHSDI